MTYGYINSMKARPGRREEVVAILLRSADSLRSMGCDLYVVSVSQTDEDTIWVTEVWHTKERHDAALQLPEAKAAVEEAMPMLTGEFNSQELTVRGGLGV